MSQASIAEAAKVALKDASRFLFFNEQGAVLASSFTVEPSELKPLEALYSDRDEAIKHGMVVLGTRYEVHRHHPPLIYGRTMGAVPEESEGCAICKIAKGLDGQACYGLITYQMPNISARMVPMLQKFCQEHLEAK
ncbi:hypothetical protein VOLCADRAFT_95924 [Volvox carteri f. nagariensis]|uniref:Profilin n=1 Tax=Volvox carteri f. nagariensis TaxID=3068 RepID=D8U8Q7_VOLCA|nr:uncharacterized protein VOLCADRAFT_95924 [Volvox carteri f. nagariensis]EFJ43847.1 hypothetical protein VOLCADRAFT_95924 [Volvox carteri f. nagariensis]|eukprot:XP_002955093.1 hypothetical protein VOLCADRAFT_95924 [Volvox carteri f. nagariensis]